jgi:hypothetical protein
LRAAFGIWGILAQRYGLEQAHRLHDSDKRLSII